MEEKNLLLIQSETRTLLAAERTFSAWLRTAMAAMAAGFAVLRISIFRTMFHRIGAHVMGELLLFWGCGIIVLAALDYRRTCRELRHVRSHKSSGLGFLLIVVPLGFISALLVWVMMPTSKTNLVAKELAKQRIDRKS